MRSQPVPQIPDHELLRCIGKGSYGEVWLARNVTGAYRAVKIVYRSSFEHERPYEREFKGIQKFEPVSRTCETQVGILHVGRNDGAGYFYYIMDLADDQFTGREVDPDSYKPWTLRSYLSQAGRLPVQECLNVGLHLTAALDHIHKNGLVHRDIKPSNIIFINRVPKLADIGLVDSSNATRSFVGTEGYIPPEGPGSPQADIYSLGKVLYEISTGRNRLDFPELPTLLKDLPEREALVQFNELVLKACEEDPKRRYQTAEEVLADLQLLKSGTPLRRIRARDRVRTVLIAVPLAVALIAGIYLGGRMFRTQDKKLSVPEKHGESSEVVIPEVSPKPAATSEVPVTARFGMALIPAGQFTMGDALDGDTDALPLSVTLSAFYIDTNLVSYSQWQWVYSLALKQGYAFAHSGAGKAANHPVQTVDWFDCIKWCNARSQQTGLNPVYYTDARLKLVYTSGELAPYANWSANGYRLPTEAEYEKAARGGLNGQRFPWGNTISQNQANYYANTKTHSYDLGPNGYNARFTNGGEPYTSPVGSFVANGYGLYDMSGNTFQWCWDWYGTPYRGGVDPHGPASGNYRVMRGVGWTGHANPARCAFRNYYSPMNVNYSVGFRCVRGL